MPHRFARFLIAPVLLTIASGLIGALGACESQTGPDAPARTNGCIDEGCTLGPGSADAGKDATQDAQ